MDAELKALLEKQGQAFEAFKVANDARLAEMEKRGTASAEATTQVETLNTTLTEIGNRLTEVEAKGNRPALGSAGEDEGTPQAKEQKGAFYAYMRGDGIAREMRAALVEDATGEILVPEDLEAGIRTQLGKLTVIRELATVRPTTSSRVRRRSMNDVTVGWGKLETGSVLPEGNLAPAEEYLYVEDLYGLVKIGEDELMDSDAQLAAYVENSFGRKTAEAEDSGFVIGTGHAAKQPEGILAGPIAVGRVNAGQVGAVKADDFIRLAYAVPAPYRKGGIYLVSSTTELAMRLLKDANGQYLWQPAVQVGAPATFNGKPVRNQEDIPGIPAAGTAGDVAIFGDFAVGYQVVDRLRITVRRLGELYAEQGMVGFIAHMRVTGGVVEPDALRALTVPAA